MGEAPARRARDLAEPFLPVEAVDLVDHAVDVEWQVRARFLDGAIVREHFVDIAAADEQVGDGQAEALDALHRFILRVGEALTELAPAVGEETQGARGGDARVFLAERTGGGIARVGENLAARRFLPLVQRLEVGFRHVHFAADFEDMFPGGGRGPGLGS